MKTNKIWFWSDPHFFHKNVIKHSLRPFDSVEDMHETLIKNYNDCVKENDTCIWVGDCFFSSSNKARSIMNRLNGKKILVIGNHDKGIEGMMNLGFDWACSEMWMRIQDTPVQIKHYPMRLPWWKLLKIRLLKKDMRFQLKYLSRRPIDRGQFLIHGHTHQKHKFNGKQIHVGVDAHNFKPVSIDYIANYIRNYKKATKKVVRLKASKKKVKKNE